ncbi:hypothetical protein DFJ77DRAFT_508309 [Powellomyces hirtus]|nr:hypothetical protein DFJ77DRAFT_508309 [Powellomyces hirtus]
MYLKQLGNLGEMNLNPKDPASIWIFEGILGARRIPQAPNDQTKRSNDIYYPANFAMLPSIALCYSERQSHADQDDKKRWMSTADSGKNFDYNFFIKSQKLGAGENAGSAPTRDKADNDLIASIKTAVSQVQCAKKQIFAEIQASDLPSKDAVELAAQIAPPFFVVQSLRIYFYVLFEIGPDIFAFKNFAEMDISKIHEDLFALTWLARCFLLFQQPMINTNTAIDSAKLRMQQKSPHCTFALLDVLQSLEQDLDPPLKLAETILENGSKAFITSLKDRIRMKKKEAEGDCTQFCEGSPDSDDLQRYQDLEMYLKQLGTLEELNLNPKDPASIWIFEGIFGARWIPQAPNDRTERTYDIYYLANFAMLPPIALRYGERQSHADQDDKKRRMSTAGCGKKVDYNFFVDSQELRAEENTGSAPTRDKADNDLIASIKTAVSQVRCAKKQIFAEIQASDLPSKDAVELAAQIAPPFFVVQGLRIYFYVLFEIGPDIFAFKNFAEMDISKIHEDLFALTWLARCFLLFQDLMIQAQCRSPHCTFALLDVLQSLEQDLDPPLKLAETILENGSKAFITSLKDRIRMKKKEAEGDCTQFCEGSPDSDDLQRYQDLEMYLKQLGTLEELNLNPKDPASIWIFEGIFGARWIPQAPNDRTERTYDIYYLANFAMLPPIALRYGERQSHADQDDKKRRMSTAGCGKKVDYNFFVDSQELRAEENTGSAPTRDKADNDLIASIKTAVSQVRCAKKQIFAEIQASDLPSKDAVELAAQIAPPFFVVQSLRIYFYVLFEIGPDIFAFKNFAEMDISKIHEDLFALTWLARCFLLFQDLMIQAQCRSPHCTFALLDVLQSLEQDLDPPLKLAETILENGSKAFITSLKDRICMKKKEAEGDCTQFCEGSPDSDDLQRYQDLEMYLKQLGTLEELNLNPKDPASIWIFEGIFGARWIPQAPNDRTERTYDIYYLANFAMLPPIALRYGARQSHADQDDKKRRMSTAGCRKKVDYNFFVDLQELRAEENTGSAPTRDKADNDLIASIKTAVSQVRCAKKQIFAEIQASDLPSKDAVELAAQIAPPFFVVQSLRIYFYVLFEIGPDIIAFKNFAEMDISKIHEDLFALTWLARCFLLFQQPMINTNTAIDSAKLRMQQKSPHCTFALLDVLQSLEQDLDPPLKLAETILENGFKAFITSLKDRIRMKKKEAEGDCAQFCEGSPDSDDLQRCRILWGLRAPAVLLVFKKAVG